ncbi:MAG: zinc ribbon domain-containing protein [Bryobacterales bacterium]|nr:zinc ribbon domain-containing protein [Bryobacterales bacterium]
MTCSNCNAELRPGLRFCEACGAPVAEDDSALLSRVDPSPANPPYVLPPSVPQAKARGGQGAFVVLAALILVIGGGIAGYITFRPKDQGVPIPPVTEVIPEQAPPVEEPLPELPPPPPAPPAPERTEPPRAVPPPKPAPARKPPPLQAPPKPAPAPPPAVAEPAPTPPPQPKAEPEPAPPPAPVRERQPILRPDPATPPPPPPPPPKPAQEAKPRYSGPSSGVVVWSGQLERGGQVTIDGSDATAGRLNGALPGVPVIVEIDTREFALAEAPSPANGWKRFTFRARNKRHTVVTVKWSVLQ